MFDQWNCGLLLWFVGGGWAAVWKFSGSPGNEEPCWLLRRAGFSKIDDLCEIVNYLLASLVRSSRPTILVSRGLLAGESQLNWSARKNIPAPRNHAVASECKGYIWVRVIGFVCDRY